MPRYKYQTSSGKSLILDGEIQPSDADVEQAAKDAGVSLVLNQPNAASASPSRVPGLIAAASSLAPYAAKGAQMAVDTASAPGFVGRVTGATGAVAPAVIAAKAAYDLANGRSPWEVGKDVAGEGIIGAGMVKAAKPIAQTVAGLAGKSSVVTDSPVFGAISGTVARTLGVLPLLLSQSGDRSFGSESTQARQARFEEEYRRMLLEKLGETSAPPTTTDIALPTR